MIEELITSEGGIKMKELFEPTDVKGVSLSNRFVYSATWDGLADDKGFCTPKNTDLMVNKVLGGVGLIITGMAFVSPEGQAAPWQLAVHSDEYLPGLKEMAKAVHAVDGKVVLQLAHGGCYSISALTGLDVVGPSANDSDKFPACREITPREIEQIVEAFAKAAGRAKKAGFDGVQLHSAHGYLLSEFLSPYFNKRTDEYGGAIENRARLLLDTLTAVRNEVGKDFPVFVKINSEDFVEGGLSADEGLQVCSMLQIAGIDAIELSGGTVYASGAFSCCRVGALESQDEKVYYREAAARYKEKVNVPLMLVGGIRSLEVAEKLVCDELADFVSLCRPLIREPNLITRWKSGDTKPATCTSCNGCFGPGIKGSGVKCIQETNNG